MTIFANFVAVAFILHFFWSYYRNCYSKGYTMDVWHYSLIFNLFVIHIMLPFIRSDLNVISIPFQLKRTQAHIDEAYLISALGYLCILLGGTLWRVHLGLGLRRTFDEAMEMPTRAAYFLLSSRQLLMGNGLLAVCMMTGVLLFYFKTAGFGFNLRGLLLVTPWLRPIAQFSAFYALVIGSYCLARFYQYKEWSMLWITLAIGGGFLFYGERSNIFALPSLMLLVLFIRMGRRLKLYWLFLGGTCGLFLVIFLDALRSPHFSLSNVVGGLLLSIFFGNSFSDTRDFALVLSFWSGQFYLGLTYLAGLLAFIPRAIFPFRDKYAVGVVTATLAGLDPRSHSGLRAGIFGEAYLNFGLPGVMLLGCFSGAVMRLIDSRMKQANRVLPRSSMRIYSYSLLGSLIVVSQNSTNASSFYTVMLILLASWTMRKVLHYLKLVS